MIYYEVVVPKSEAQMQEPNIQAILATLLGEGEVVHLGPSRGDLKEYIEGEQKFSDALNFYATSRPFDLSFQSEVMQ